MKSTRPLLLLASLIASACASPASPDMGDEESDCFTCGKADSLSLLAGSCEAARLLAVVAEADLEALDHTIGLDSRAAIGIVQERPFASLDALDAVPYVGPVAFDRLVEYTASINALACTAPTLIEGEPNTEFGETFIALQEETDGPCTPFGGAFYYEEMVVPSDAEVALALAEHFMDAPTPSGWQIGAAMSRDQDLAPFLDSIGLGLGGLHTAIGFDDYHASWVTAESDHAVEEIAVLHYRDRGEVWTISRSCPVAP